MMPAFRALLSHWARSPLQLFTLVVGLALATALWSGVQAINAEARASYALAADQTDRAAQPLVVAKTKTKDALRTKDFVALRKAGWSVSPQILRQFTEGDLSITLLGIEPLTASEAYGFAGKDRTEAAPEDFDLVRFFKGEVLTGSESAAALLQKHGFASRVSTSLPPQQAIADIGTMQRVLDLEDRLDHLVFTGPKGAASELQRIAPHLTVLAPQNTVDIARLTKSFHLNLTAFGLLAFAVGLFIVYGAIGLAFEQRRAMFRTLRALGLSLHRLILLLIAELAVISLASGALGIALGYVVAAALMPDVAATLDGLYGAEIDGALRFRASWGLSGLAMALGGTAIAASGALLRLSRLPLLDAGAPEAWAHAARRTIRVMFWTGLALLACAIAMMFSAKSLIAGFILLGSLMVGAALMLPLVLDRLLAVVSHLAKSALSVWFWADTRAQIPALSMALMALLLAVSANIGVTTMVSSFRLTFTGWLDQRLASELYVRLDAPEQADALRDLAKGTAEAILPIVSAPSRFGDQAGEIYTVLDHATYRDHWPLLAATPDVWNKLQQPGHMLINEQLARSAGLGLGAKVPGQDGDVVVGIYSDYGNPAPQAIIGYDVFRHRFPERRAKRFGLRVDPAKAEALAEHLRAHLDVQDDAIANQTQIKKMSQEIFERTFSVTSALNVLTLAVAAFSILTSLLTLSQMRLPYLAPVWALGVTRASLGRFELLRAIALAGFVTVLAVPLGLALAWVLLTIVNVAAFGWQLPMTVFPARSVWLMIWSLAAACLAALWPAWRLMRRPPAQLLQVFSSGR